MVATATPARGVAGFNDSVRQQILVQPSIAVGSGPRVLDFNRVGFMARVYVEVDATVNITMGAGSAAYGIKAPYSLIRRIRLLANNGFEIWNTTGYGLYLHNLIARFASPQDQGLISSLGAITTDFYNKPTLVNGNNAIRFSLALNIAINERDPVGLVLLQNDETTVTVEITWDEMSVGGTTSDTITLSGGAVFGATPIAGNAEIHLEYFTVPQDPKAFPPLNLIHQVLEHNEPMQTTTGNNTFTIPRGNTYLRIINTVINNAAFEDAAMTSWKLMINQSDAAYDMNWSFTKSLQRRRYGIDLPKGTMVWDFYHSTGLVNLGNNRDWIHSQDLSLLQQIVVLSGATFGSGNNNIETIKDMLVPLVGAAA